MKHLLLITALIIAAVFLYTTNQTMAVDPPHSTAQSVQCSSCHSVHRAPGVSLTNNASNANLCLSCHTSGGLADTKRLAGSMQAIPGTEGTSHRWDTSIAGGVAPLNLVAGDSNNIYGLRTAAELSSAVLKGRLNNYGNIVTCSICHSPHGQALTTWNPNAPAYTGKGTGSGRNFQRISTDLNAVAANVNDMCEDCHYYRKAATSGTDVRTWSGNNKSHPVVKIFTNDAGRDVTYATQFHNTPIEPNYNAQTPSPRYYQNGAGDANETNNIVLDSSSKVRCLSCHGVHYTDSSSGTVDGP